MSRIHYSHCPVCGSSNINPLQGVKDHSVSGEDFVVWYCSDCTLRFTQDVPDENAIGDYYQSADYISHSNTDKGLVNKTYQLVRKRTLEQKSKLIVGETKERGRILDVGAGIGAFLNVMKQREWEVKGIEPDEGARSKAKELFDLDLSDTSSFYSLQDNQFDAITLWHVLEHVHDLHAYMEKLRTLLKPDGKLFIAVPNYQSLDASIYKSYWAAYDVPRHLYHFSPRSIKVLLQKHGLLLTAKKPMWYDSFYISLLSSKYKFGKTGWVSAVWNGMRSDIAAIFNRDRFSSLIYIAKKA